jgi:hypothetical protein
VLADKWREGCAYTCGWNSNKFFKKFEQCVSTAVKKLDSDPGIPNLLFLRKCSDGSASIYINCLE